MFRTATRRDRSSVCGTEAAEAREGQISSAPAEARAWFYKQTQMHLLKIGLDTDTVCK